MKTRSIVALLLMALGLVWMLQRHALFGEDAPALAVQIAAVALMLWARVTFGRRSFHAAANPTEGGVVTSGPYAWIRHPIYAAILYFTWAGAIDHRSRVAFAGATLVTIGGVVRMLAEERLLVLRYPEYRDYMRRVRRVIPSVF